MRLLIANLTVIFWSFIFGMIIGYLGSSLAGLPYNLVGIGITSAIVAVIATNGLKFCFMNKKQS